jgi:hypothetical protein
MFSMIPIGCGDSALKPLLIGIACPDNLSIGSRAARTRSSRITKA